jgi:hypothetical protein
MALKLTVDSLDGVDENLRALYVEKDGKFSLAVDGIEDTSALKEALRKERKRADDAEKQKKAWERSGKTPEEIQELLDAQEQRAQTEAEKKGEWDKLRAQMNDRHALDLKAKDETIGQMRKRLQAELVDAKAVSALAAAKGSPDLLLPHVQRHVKVDDDFNVVVVDSKGDPRVNGKGEPLSIADLIEEMKANETFGRAFEGSGHSGSGMRPNSGGGGTPPGNVKSKADLKDRSKRAAFVDQHGHEAYFALPDK